MNAERKEANAASRATAEPPRIFRVGEGDAHRHDGLSVTEIEGTVAKAIVSKAFLLTQPSDGDVFGWIDDHSEQLAKAVCAAIVKALESKSLADLELLVNVKQARQHEAFLRESGFNDG